MPCKPEGLDCSRTFCSFPVSLNDWVLYRNWVLQPWAIPYYRKSAHCTQIAFILHYTKLVWAEWLHGIPSSLSQPMKGYSGRHVVILIAEDKPVFCTLYTTFHVFCYCAFELDCLFFIRKWQGQRSSTFSYPSCFALRLQTLTFSTKFWWMSLMITMRRRKSTTFLLSWPCRLTVW